MSSAAITAPGRVAVTGAAGAIGSRVVGLLAVAGLPVTALVRDATRAHPAAEAVVVDYADPPSLDAALRGVDSLVFIGATAMPTGSSRTTAMSSPPPVRPASDGSCC